MTLVVICNPGTSPACAAFQPLRPKPQNATLASVQPSLPKYDARLIAPFLESHPMFDAICALIPRDPDYPPRVATLDVLRRVLAGTVYDVLPFRFHEERGAGGEYISHSGNTVPSIRYALCRTVVEDSVALLFSEGHFPDHRLHRS